MECKLWSIVRMGWSLRYKVSVKNVNPVYGNAWYAPGFGKNDTSTWGGTVNLMFDIGKSALRNKSKKHVPSPQAEAATEETERKE